MSIVLIGGNECMERQYKDACSKYNLKAKVFSKMGRTIKDKMGSPDLLVVFTNTVSHKMLKCALCEAKCKGCKVCYCKQSSLTALNNILDDHFGGN